MKLYLFGGAELDLGHHVPQLKLIEKIIHEIGPKQVLHIPFARSPETEIAWGDDWFIKDVDLTGIEYLNAKNETDINKADNPLVVITGGGNTMNVLEKIKTNSKLLNLVINARCIIGESAGSMILGEYLRIKPEGNNTEIVKGLGILKDTIIEPHYTERNRHQLLEQEMKQLGLSFGIGIDCVTAMCFDLKVFPNTYTTIGDGLIEIKTKKEKIAIVDENDNVIGCRYRSTLDKKEWYRVSALWITNSNGNILLAKRHRTKKHNPNKRGPAAAGTVEYGETYQENIIKEAFEELGLEQVNPKLGPKIKDNGEYFHFTQRYTLCCDKYISEFKIQEDEVAEIAWFSPKQLEQMLKEHPDDFLPNMKKYVELFQIKSL